MKTKQNKQTNKTKKILCRNLFFLPFFFSFFFTTGKRSLNVLVKIPNVKKDYNSIVDHSYASPNVRERFCYYYYYYYYSYSSYYCIAITLVLILF